MSNARPTKDSLCRLYKIIDYQLFRLSNKRNGSHSDERRHLRNSLRHTRFAVYIHIGGNLVKKMVAILMIYVLAVLISPLPAMASTTLTQAQVNAKAKDLADKYGVQLGITPPLDFDFTAAEQALSTFRSSRVIETISPDTEIPTTFAFSTSTLEVYCKKKYWHLGIYTEFAVAADAHYVSDANGRPDFFTSIDAAQYAVAGGGSSSVNVEIRHVNGVRSWLSSGQKANVDARYTVRYWTFGFFSDHPDTCPGNRRI